MYINFIKFVGINLFVVYILHKLINDIKINNIKRISIILATFCLACFESFTKDYDTTTISILFFSYFLYSFIIGKLTNISLGYSLMVIIICSSFSFLLYFISTFFTAILLSLIPTYNYANILTVIFSFFIEAVFIFLLFKIKRLKNGFPFLKSKRNDYSLDVFIFIICITALFIYFLMLNYPNISFKDTAIIITIFISILSITLYNSFIIYQKHKLLEKTIKDYEQELSESKAQLEMALKEKNNLVKANHEFYHRQQALSLKLDNLMKNKNSLFKEEYGGFVDRIDTLSKEYNNVISSTILPVLPNTNIPEIDDMFIYLQNECNKNNIEFTLRLTCDVYQLINNIIPKNKLETLIGDLIRNSIIAINNSTYEPRSIMVILGIKDEIYEFSVYDTGIEFQIDTLLKLGIECATTHKDSGGTGIGFITTFETLKYCNASLIINEFSDKAFHYTKSITIRFDYKNNYIIETYRSDDFYKYDNIRDGLIIKPNSDNITD